LSLRSSSSSRGSLDEVAVVCSVVPGLAGSAAGGMTAKGGARSIEE
jgi:hypothetical protein